MNYSNDENKLVGAEPAEARQAVRALATTFFAGLVLSLCFIFPILRHCEKITFARTEKLNPNAATVSELAELPSIGEKKARAIIDYRNGQKTLGKTKAFEKAGDLEDVNGIGEKTVEKLERWLEFE